ncbi:MAG: 3-deoxy-manno-octulosonate cytidylyltransferase [Bdellovibrionaceae bacterium]|nr:3-deoxy-manno-octulosonate cytidylyltransferase [Pseudobdellovibrionaceae bacterium]
MELIGVIPARLGSTRLERKPLQPLKNKPIILWVCEAVAKCQALDGFFVATDSEEIAAVVTEAGFKVVMTPVECASGTDRIWQALSSHPEYQTARKIINIQGDEPLIDPRAIEALAEFIKQQNEDCWVTLGAELVLEDIENKNAVKVVVNQKGKALYFSRWPIPFSRTPPYVGHPNVLKHVGLYAYTYEALKSFCEAPVSDLEQSESLEQLRALDLGYSIYVLKTDYHSQGVDTKEDLLKLEKFLTQQ